MAKGIKNIDSLHLMTFHPPGAKNAIDFFNEDWLDFDMFQSGHSRLAKEYNYVFKSHKKNPPRPVVNGEARYENIKDRFWTKKEHGWLDDTDARISAYWSIIAGAAGYTYGCNDIWQMYDITKKPILNARTGWETSLNLPGAEQMGFMKKIFELLPWQEMVCYPALILNENQENESYTLAAIGKNKDFIVAYIPNGKEIKVDISKLKLQHINGYWFNPRSGKIKLIGRYKTTSPIVFKPWADGWGSDFLLILVDENLKIDFDRLKG